ncbi:MAG TPA: hypothetical protein VE959_20185 [Bryobacteraceae bacterium]|nr:hypothetical protein [Bryobacteraceae bacterium]
MKLKDKGFMNKQEIISMNKHDTRMYLTQYIIEEVEEGLTKLWNQVNYGNYSDDRTVHITFSDESKGRILSESRKELDRLPITTLRFMTNGTNFGSSVLMGFVDVQIDKAKAYMETIYDELENELLY